MPQAKITLAGTKADNTAFGPTVGSELDAKINSVVNLDNLNSGGELTFTWSILDQPPGALDSLSSVSAQNPFFTPKKEGSYLIRLIVNQSLPTEQEDRVVLSIVQLKTRERLPAAGETTESDTSDGWAVSMNSLLRRVDFLLSDPGILVGVNGSGGVLNRGAIVRAPATDIIKATLPGAETVPSFTSVSAATLSTIDELLCVVEGTPFGLPGVPGVGSAEQRLMRTRYIGRISALPIAGPPPTAGDVLFVNDAGAISSIQGTIRRRIGSSMTTGSPADVWFNGVGGADIDLPSIAEPYVTNGPSALPNAFRIDGANAGARTAAMGPFEVHTGDVATPTTRWRRFSSLGASIGEWTTEGGVPLVRVTATGQLVIEVGAGGLFVNSVGIALLATLPFTQGTGTTSQFILDDNDVNVNRRKLKFSHDDGFGNFYDNYMQYTYLGGVGRRGMVFVNQTNTGTATVEIEGAGDGFGFAKAYINLNASTGGQVTLRNQQGTLHFDSLSGSISANWSSGGVFDFTSSSNPLWRIDGFGAGGALSAMGGNRFIHNVADPLLPQDAATKVYSETVAWEHNGAHNGNFAIWQRGASGTVTQNAATYGATRGLYRADRWFCNVRVDTVAGGLVLGNNTASYTRVSTGGVAGVSEFAASVAVTGRQTGAPNASGFTFLFHDFDRDFVKRARGKKVTISFKWRKGAGFDAPHAVIDFIYSDGNVFRNQTNYTGTTGNLMGIFTAAASIPAAWGTTHATFVTTGVVPLTTTTMGIAIGRPWGASAYGATNSLEITDVVALIGDFATLTEFPQYPLAGGSHAGSMDICQRFYETSALQGGPPNFTAGANQDNSVLTWAMFDRYVVFPYKTRKWAAPVLYDFTGQAQGFSVFSNVFPGPVWTAGTITEAYTIGNGLAIAPAFSFATETQVVFAGVSPGAPFGTANACFGAWACDIDFG